MAAFTFAGAIVGVVNGLTLSGIVLATERGKKIEELRMWRFATWGAVATAGTLGLFFESLLAGRHWRRAWRGRRNRRTFSRSSRDRNCGAGNE